MPDHEETNVPDHPDRMRVVVPSLTVDDVDAAIGFYAAVLGAVESPYRLEYPGGGVAYAEVVIAGEVIMLNEPVDGGPNRSASEVGATPVRIHVYVEDVDATMTAAEQAGAEVLIPASDQFYGDRSGRFRDPSGHEWIVATLLEDLGPDQMRARMAEAG